MDIRKNPSALFAPQHRNKCYCQSELSCSCKLNSTSSKTLLRKNSNSTSQHKFIKIRQGKSVRYSANSVKSNLGASTLSSFPSTQMSQCSNQRLTSQFKELGSQNSTYFKKGVSPLTTFKTQSLPQLTEQREQYERTKELIHQAQRDPVNTCYIIPSKHGTLCNLSIEFTDEQLESLQKFRLQNQNDCFSEYRQRATQMQQRLNDFSHGNSHDNSPEKSYFLNERGLLELDEGQRKRQFVLEKNSQTKTPSKIVPFVTDAKSLAHKILQQRMFIMQDKESVKEFRKKMLCIPENSLALCFQETY